jgi:hypothetical protein
MMRCLQAIEEGKCLLEFKGPENEAPLPLLKDVFSSERRKAKARGASA